MERVMADMGQDVIETKNSALIKTVNKNLKASQNAQNAWRNQALTSYDFYAGHQWSQEDEARLRNQERPTITFNRTVRVVNAVTGLEVQNRQTIVYIPREPGDAIASELLTGAADWVRDNTDAEDEESQAFKDCVITGMGWIETRLDYERDPDGEIIMDRVDPLEMRWDPTARKRNLDDAKWVARVRKFTKKEFKEFWPDVELRTDGTNDIYINETETMKPIDVEESRYYRADSGDQVNDQNQKISVIQYQWWERETFYRVQKGEEIQSLSKKEFNNLKPMIETMGFTYVKQIRRKYKQAFIYGQEILEEGDSPVDGFTFNAITGLQDRNLNSWFGLLYLMHDPQMYANKWLSQILYILNTNPSGGYFYEIGAIQDIRRFGDDLSHPAKNIELNPGGLGKIQPKNPVTFPGGIDKLMNYAIEATNDLVGVNLEMLGIANRDQAGVLEESRKNAGITILADFFDALRRYRKEQGRILAEFILKYISDGRLVKIEGEELGRYVPLLREQLNFKYDIIVDEQATSANSKQHIYAMLSSIIPQLQSAGIPIPPEVLDYLPLPADLVMKWKKMLTEQEPDQMQQFADEIKKKLAELEVQQQEQKLAQGKVNLQKSQADIAKSLASAEYDNAKAAHETALTQVDTSEMRRENLQAVLELLQNFQAANLPQMQFQQQQPQMQPPEQMQFPEQIQGVF